MTNNLSEEIKSYILEEIEYIISPDTNSMYNFNDLEDTLRNLDFLLFEDIAYEDLDRVGQNFIHHIQSIIEGNLNDYPIAIEGLATNYEAFLKKIAYLKYKGTNIWDGDENCVGLKATMFDGLFQGLIRKHNRVRGNFPIPEPLVDYNDTKKEILDFVRANLRNSVHIAKEYRKRDLLSFSNLVIGCYLFTIDDNELFLKNKLLPEYKYLQNIVKQDALSGLDNVYIELIGQEASEKIEIIGRQITDEYQLLSSIENFNHEPDENSDDIEDIYIDNITSIINDNKNILMIGSPGSGKSTTLKKVLFSNAKKIINGENETKFPIYIEANEYRLETKSFRNIINSKFDDIWFIKALEKGKVQIFIDGINEIINDYKIYAINEIKSLISLYPNSSFIITDRRYGYIRNLNLPIFELKNLDEIQIKEFIDKNSEEINSKAIWCNLSNNIEMLELASNPLMLKMILAVSNQGQIPMNRGLLYDLFINTILIREEDKKKQFDRDLKKEILSEIAYNIRMSGQISVEREIFNSYISKTINRLKCEFSEILFCKQILDNNLVKSNENDEISFLHETYQEYFCAAYFKKLFISNGELNIEVENSFWIEPILLCNDLLKKEPEQFNFFQYLFRGQKEIRERKRINDFDKDDYNPHISIACKVANKHRTSNNLIYRTAKSYLKNYLVLSKVYFLKNQDFPVPLNNIFNSIASLNSIKLLEQIFITPFWVEQWLFDNNAENNIVDKDKKTEFKELAFEIINNSPDFSPLLDLVAISEKENIWFKSVLHNLKMLWN